MAKKLTVTQRLAAKRRVLRKPSKPTTPIATIMKTEARIKIANRAGRAAITETRIGLPAHTARRAWRSLRQMGIDAPGFAPVKTHTRFVKRFANEIAKTYNEKVKAAGRPKAFLVDRGMVNQASLWHDSRRHFKEQDKQAQIYAAQLGATKLARVIGTGMAWTPENSVYWPMESKMMALGDTVCRGIKVGNSFLNGIVPHETAFKILVAQRYSNPANVDALVLERIGQAGFVAQLERGGVDIKSIIRKQRMRNPKSFLPAINQKIKEVGRETLASEIASSMKRLGIKSVKRLKLEDKVFEVKIAAKLGS